MRKRLIDRDDLTWASNRFCKKAGCACRFSCGLGFLIWAVRDSFDGEIRCRGETDEPAARRSPGRPVSPASRGDHQPSPSAGAAGGGDRLGLSGATLQLGVSGGTRTAAFADAAGAGLFILKHM